VNARNESVSNQQTKDCIVTNTLLANECCTVGFGVLIGIGATKSYAHDPSRHRTCSWSLSVLLNSHFTFPPAVRATVGADDIEERSATANCPVAQNHDATIATHDAIECLSLK
jgi:hypothetical protein